MGKIIEGINCSHPDFSDGFSKLYQVRENIFSKKDPICLDCLKCNCLEILLKPEGERAKTGVMNLFVPCPHYFLCNDCHIRKQCYSKALRHLDLEKTVNC